MRQFDAAHSLPRSSPLPRAGTSRDGLSPHTSKQLAVEVHSIERICDFVIVGLDLACSRESAIGNP